MSHRPRYFRTDFTKATICNAHEQLVASLARLVAENPPSQVPLKGGIYYGTISVAYLFFALQKYYPDLIIQGYSLSAWFAAYLEPTKEVMHHAPSAKSCGVGNNVLALLALQAVGSDAK